MHSDILDRYLMARPTWETFQRHFSKRIIKSKTDKPRWCIIELNDHLWRVFEDHKNLIEYVLLEEDQPQNA